MHLGTGWPEQNLRIEGYAVSSNLEELYRRMLDIQTAIEHAVTATPSGEKRNLLTDVNIHLMIAMAALAEVPGVK